MSLSIANASSVAKIVASKIVASKSAATTTAATPIAAKITAKIALARRCEFSA